MERGRWGSGFPRGRTEQDCPKVIEESGLHHQLGWRCLVNKITKVVEVKNQDQIIGYQIMVGTNGKKINPTKHKTTAIWFYNQ